MKNIKHSTIIKIHAYYMFNNTSAMITVTFEFYWFLKGYLYKMDFNIFI